MDLEIFLSNFKNYKLTANSLFQSINTKSFEYLNLLLLLQVYLF